MKKLSYHYPRILLLLLAMIPFWGELSYAQQSKYEIRGIVRDESTGDPVPYATVLLEEAGLWFISGADGTFHISGVPSGTHTIRVEILGYAKKTFSQPVENNISGLVLQIAESSLRLEEVVVTAEEGGRLNSSSRIEKQALDHVQPASLRDIMQLVPGNLTENPALNRVNQLTIRDIGSNKANAFGTAVIIDGVTMSNDANLQVRKTSSIGTVGESTAGSGVDARQVATDNIQSVEVVRGIPSVLYGDLTSGAVIVKTRSGVAPWQVRLKADPRLKQVYAGKGFSLGKDKGIINIDGDYALSYGDVRTPADVYRRVNMNIGYSGSFSNKMIYNSKLHLIYSDADNRTDPDNFLDNISRDTDMGVGLDLNGTYRLNKKWITSLDFLISGQVTSQYSREKMYRSQGRIPQSLALSSGENLGFFTPYRYYSDLEIFGLPVNVLARLVANLYGKYGNITNKALAGIEWTTRGNRGKGKIFDPYLSPDINASSTFRERSFRDIPFLNRYSIFAEDKVRFPLGGTRSLEIQAGARFNGIVPDERFSMERYFSLEPRLNARFQVIRKQKGLRNLSFRAGWGMNYKMPSMVYLYPEPTYLDVVSFSYNDIDDNGVGMALFTTRKLEEEVRNPGLKLQQSTNFETGMDFDIDDASGTLVFFKENMINGYGFSTQVVPVSYNRYGYIWDNGSPSRIDVPSGKLPQYSDGAVYIDGIALPVIRDTVFLSYQKPVNNIMQNKWGIEFTVDFPEIQSLHTTVSVNGAYLNVKTQDESLGAITVGTQVAGRPYPYAGIYAGGSKTSTGSRKERLNTNIRFITHLPAVGMVVTITAQLVLMDRTTYVCEWEDQVQTYYYDDKGSRYSGRWAYKDDKWTKRVNPLYIMDLNGNIIPFTQDMENDVRYRELIGTTNKESYYLGARYPVYGILNVRLTKEIGKRAAVSFYANNFLNLDQLVTEKLSGTAYARNLPFYFGAEVKLTL
ncbi:MAG: carboxypeptidase-like regulatory domain-containing protein [Bacteroidales bacterium]|jgi:hypothetical protein|nr:TonB-dependent receptor [Bacteroidales bacterium]MDD2264025.1 TonB-dependent receptor [Bacteroidales bacterium]MDD2831259.1 TonB-dependent receptor [Bacteroidales bacterium]MDD3208628.1 TonB-dependent receptor [Bacteroidales bacterium]MDD3697191.1 TonB-dependent receptor [Bacteroidales bacterium]